MKKQKSSNNFASLLKSQKNMLDKIVMNISSMQDSYATSKFLNAFQVSISDILAFLDINLTHERKSKAYFLTDDDIKDFSTLQAVVLTNLERINQLLTKLNESHFDIVYYLDTIIRSVYTTLSSFIRKR